MSAPFRKIAVTSRDGLEAVVSVSGRRRRNVNLTINASGYAAQLLFALSPADAKAIGEALLEAVHHAQQPEPPAEGE